MCFDWGLNRVIILPGLNLDGSWISIEPGMLWVGVELTWLVIFGREFGCVPGNGASLVFAACGGFESGDGDGHQFLC